MVNGHYPPSNTKHLAQTTDKLAMKPVDFAERIRQICEVAIIEAMPLAKSLIEEIFAIIEAAGYDITQRRATFYNVRPPNSHPIVL